MAMAMAMATIADDGSRRWCMASLRSALPSTTTVPSSPSSIRFLSSLSRRYGLSLGSPRRNNHFRLASSFAGLCPVNPLLSIGLGGIVSSSSLIVIDFCHFLFALNSRGFGYRKLRICRFFFLSVVFYFWMISFLVSFSYNFISNCQLLNHVLYQLGLSLNLSMVFIEFWVMC